MLSSIVLAFRRTVDSAYDQILQERAIAVAQRQIELLLASEQEPDSTGLFNQDELDPLFSWQMELKRVAPSSSRVTIETSIIMAKVTVKSNLLETQSIEPIELYRYFATLNPREGQEIAVPPIPAYQQDPWYEELKKKLGHEPTSEEVLQEIIKKFDLPDEFKQELEDLDDLDR